MIQRYVNICCKYRICMTHRYDAFLSKVLEIYYSLGQTLGLVDASSSCYPNQGYYPSDQTYSYDQGYPAYPMTYEQYPQSSEAASGHISQAVVHAAAIETNAVAMTSAGVVTDEAAAMTSAGVLTDELQAIETQLLHQMSEEDRQQYQAMSDTDRQNYVQQMAASYNAGQLAYGTGHETEEAYEQQLAEFEQQFAEQLTADDQKALESMSAVDRRAYIEQMWMYQAYSQ